MYTFLTSACCVVQCFPYRQHVFYVSVSRSSSASGNGAAATGKKPCMECSGIQGLLQPLKVCASGCLMPRSTAFVQKCTALYVKPKQAAAALVDVLLLLITAAQYDNTCGKLGRLTQHPGA